MNHRRVLPSVVCVWLALASAAAAAAAEFWWTKPSEQWSKKEAHKVLFDSPWAQSGVYPLAELMSEEVRARFDFRKLKDVAPAGAEGIINQIAVRLRSALPVRQAFVRQTRLESKYDKMSDADKAEFDAAAKRFVECAACAEYYVVTVDSNILDALRASHPGVYSPELFKSRAYLANDRGQWRPCERVEQENRELVFFFRRAGAGERAFIAPGDKTFRFTLSGEASGGEFSPGAYWEFKVSKLTRGGRVEF